jgi:hypothetical protein
MTEDVRVPPALADLGVPVEHRQLSSGHMVMVSKPQELATIVNDVIRRA